MRVYIQWAKSTAEDWSAYDVRTTKAVRDLAKKAVPTGGSTVDEQPGWVNAANVQGVIFTGSDHVAVEPSGASFLRVTTWNDDPEDWPPGTRHAVVWTFEDVVNGNTRQTCTVYAEPNPDPALVALGGAVSTGGPNRLLPWTEFVAPPANMTFHGIWLSQELHAAHEAVRTLRGWTEWVP